MKTENEIKSAPLEEQQKLVIELRAVKTDDKFYGTAKALIAFITGLKKFKEPDTIEVKNIAEHDVLVDGKTIQRDATAKLYHWQFKALARYFEPVNEDDLSKVFPAAKEEKEKKAAGAVAAIIIAFLLLFGAGNVATAQTQQLAVGGPGQYNVYYIAGLNGGTNFISGTNNYLTGVITTNITIVPSWYNSNGISYFNTATNTSYTTNTPGLFGLVNYDLADVFFGGQLMTAGTGTNATVTVDYSDDAVFWRTNAQIIQFTANGTAFVGTNVTLSAFGPGYLRFGFVGYPSAVLTNVVLEVSRKTSKTGP